MKTFRQFNAAGTLAFCGLLTVAALTAPASAQEACAFFKGKTVELVVPFSAGGGYDVYGRMVAKYMGGHLGAANMIVRNQPGAGGLLATNQTYVAEPDGLRIQLMPSSGMVTAELGEEQGVQYKSAEFSWIGRLTREPDILATSPGGKIKTIEDLKTLSGERKIKFGSVGLGDMDYIEGQLLTRIFDLNSDVVSGFSSVPEMYASLGRGELDLASESISAFQSAEKAEAARALWVFGTEPVPELPGVKPLSDFVDAEDVPLVKAVSDVVGTGRALAGPPKMAADRLKCLRDAFDDTMTSAEFKEESKKLNRPVSPLGGEEMAQLVSSVISNAPQEYLDILRTPKKQ